MVETPLIEPKITDQITSDDDRAQAIADFNALKNTRGWQRIVEYYEGKVKFHILQLTGELGDEAIESMEDLKLIRYKLNSCEQFKNLPDVLSGFLALNDKEESFDPYATSEDIEQDLKTASEEAKNGTLSV